MSDFIRKMPWDVLAKENANLLAENERLRKALLKIRDGSLGGPANSSGWGRCVDIADKALRGVEEAEEANS